jgi:nitroreductase/NAD-dependent dihydropyrimidine dehydrogenase PreA subunit
MLIEKHEDKCSECMLCVRACTSGVWRVVDGKSRPVDIDLCNCCSQCIAVCPCDAISHDGLDKEQITKVNRNNLNPDVYRDIVLSRRSIREFKDEPVPREVIEKIIDLARYAPTASNDQNVAYIVITNRRLIKEAADYIFGFAIRIHDKTKKGIGRFLVNLTGLANNRYLKKMDYYRKLHAENGRDFILHNAPVLILFHAPGKKPFASDNCNIAATTIINYAHTLGLGTCFIGFLTMALQFSGKLRKKLGVPENRKVYATLVMGYPAYRYANTVSRKNPEVQWL